jgi:AraC-like DNA-binding protein
MDSPAKFVIAFQGRLKRGNCCPVHAHAGVEIVFHFSGHGVTRCVDGSSFAFAPGDAIVYPPGMAHDQSMHSDGVDHCLQVSMPSTPFTKTFKLEGIRSQTALAELNDLSCWFDEAPQEAKDLRAAATLLTLLHENTRSDSGERDPSFVQAAAARGIAMAETSRPPSSAEIARRLGVSADYLRHLMAKHFGKGLKEISLEARLSRAMSLLANSPMGLKEIAGETGFANARALCAAFKSRTGSTPGGFRKRTFSRLEE